MSEERLTNVIKNLGLTAYTDNTIVDENQLKKEIEIVRREGVAFDEEEYLRGVMSVGAPLETREGDLIASIGIVCPTLRVNSQKLRQLATMVKRTAIELSNSINVTEKLY